jgi:hypothetical protein
VFLLLNIIPIISYAEWDDEAIERFGEGILIEETGEIIYPQYRFKEPTTGKLLTWYPVRVTDGKKEALKILDYTIYVEDGQLALTTIDNQGDIYNMDVLKKPENYNKMFDIFQNCWNHTGQSYISKLGRRYPTVYAKDERIPKDNWGKTNYNVKDTTGQRDTKQIDPVPNKNKLIFTTPEGLKVNFRTAMTKDGAYQGFCFYTKDVGFKDFKPKSSVVFKPWEKHRFGIMEGKFNKLFNEEFRRTGNIDEKWVKWYQIFCQQNKGLDATMISKAKMRRLEPTKENQARMFYEGYYAVHDVTTNLTNGVAMEIHGNSRYYATLTTSIITSLKNLRVASPENPIGQYNKIDILDAKTRRLLNHEKDILNAGQKILKRTYVGFENSVNASTYNKSIQINSFVLYNNNKDFSHTDEFYPLISSKNFGNVSLKSISEGFTFGNGMHLQNEENVAIYEEEIVVPEYTKGGEFLEQITFGSALPFQTNSYTSEDIEKNDNQKTADDLSTIIFKVKQKNENDLIISDMKLTDKKGDIVDKVIKNQEYILQWKIKNIGQTDTKTVIDHSIFTNTLQGQYFSELRDGGIGNTVNSDNPRILKKGEEIEFKTKIHIPVNVTDNIMKISAFIPKAFDISDNKYIYEDDVKTIKFPIINPSGSKENLAVVDIRLLDSQTQIPYEQLNTDNLSYDFDLNKSYDIEVLVEKKYGTAVIIQPKLDLYIRDSQQAVEEIQLTSKNTLSKSGDTAVFRLKGYRTDGNTIDILSQIPNMYREQGLNDIQSDDTMTKIWKKEINFTATNLKLNPNHLSIGKRERLPKENIGFTVNLGSSMTSKKSIDNVLFVILDKNNNVVYEDKNIDFSGNLIKYQGTIKNYNLKEGNNPFMAVINHNKAIQEYDGSKDPYDDNTSTSNVLVKRDKENKEKEMLKCSSYNLQNNWSQTFQMHRKTGSMKSKTVCSKKKGCRTVTYCLNVKHKYWKETRSYYERFRVEKVMFRSLSTIEKYGGDGWVNILGNNNGQVRAGQWYEVYLVTHYETNRPSMPDRWRRNKCNYQTRSPGLSSLPNSLEYISLKISGYGETEYYSRLYHYKSENSWYNHKRYYRPELRSGTDIMNETSTRRYIPKTGKDGTILLNVVTKEFRGYEYDEKHPRKLLQDCKNIKIYVNDPLNVKSQVIGNN